MLALAPYLGDSDLHDEIHAAGGLAKWKAPARVTTLNADNYQSQLFRWLQAVTADREPGPIIHLAYGDDDRLAKADSLLAAVLPKERVYTGAGEHNWVTWRGLFQRFLDSSALMEQCGAPSSAP